MGSMYRRCVKIKGVHVCAAQLLMLILMTLMQYCATIGLMKQLDCSAAFFLVLLRTHDEVSERVKRLCCCPCCLHQPTFVTSYPHLMHISELCVQHAGFTRSFLVPLSALYSLADVLTDDVIELIEFGLRKVQFSE